MEIVVNVLNLSSAFTVCNAHNPLSVIVCHGQTGLFKHMGVSFFLCLNNVTASVIYQTYRTELWLWIYLENLSVLHHGADMFMPLYLECKNNLNDFSLGCDLRRCTCKALTLLGVAVSLSVSCRGLSRWKRSAESLWVFHLQSTMEKMHKTMTSI